MSRYGEDVYTSGFIWMKEGDLAFEVFPSVDVLLCYDLWVGTENIPKLEPICTIVIMMIYYLKDIHSVVNWTVRISSHCIA